MTTMQIEMSDFIVVGGDDEPPIPTREEEAARRALDRNSGSSFEEIKNGHTYPNLARPPRRPRVDADRLGAVEKSFRP
jgi:hypothetical protein